MNAAQRTYYEILGITRNAKPHEVKRAYDRIRAELRTETAAPDPRRLVQVQTAYEVLSDEARRAAYDEALRRVPMRAARKRRLWVLAGGAAIVALGCAAWFATRPTGPKPRTETEILSMVTPAVGRVHALAISGGTSMLGIAVAIGPGRLAMPCGGLAPGMELVVRIGSRGAPARVADASGQHGYCLIRAPEAGSWPLPVAGRLPRAGDKVYIARVSPSGDVSLLEARVERIERRAHGAVLQLSGAAAHEEGGAALVDVWGRLLAISDGRGGEVPIDESDARGE